MEPPGNAVTVIVAAVGVLTAGVGGAFALGLVGAPAVDGVENRFGPVDNQTTVICTDLVVDNPNPVGVQLGGTTINYTVKMNGVAMAGGSKTGLDLSPGESTLEFETRMQNGKIPPWWVAHIENGERTTVSIDSTVRTSLLGHRTVDHEQERTVETNIIGQFNSNEPRPVNAPQTPPLTSNPVLYINRTSADWGTVTQAQTPIEMEFDIYNPKVRPYVITEVGYHIRMNGVPVGNGSSERSLVIPGGATRTLPTETVVRNDKLDEWWVTHLRNDQVTQLRIDFYARVELPTGNDVRVPLDRLTYEKTIETDIFDTKNETDSGSTDCGVVPAVG